MERDRGSIDQLLTFLLNLFAIPIPAFRYFFGKTRLRHDSFVTGISWKLEKKKMEMIEITDGNVWPSRIIKYRKGLSSEQQVPSFFLPESRV